MEQQSTDLSTSQDQPQPSPSTPEQDDLTASISASAHSLRFPKPQGSQHLANWVSDSSPDITSPPAMTHESNLADSAYELINSTDGESQDSQISDSVSSLDYPRADDVHSLNGGSSCRTDSDEEDADEQSASSHSAAPSIRYADQGLQNPSAHPVSSNLEFQPTPDANMLPQSIEFLEADADDEDGHIHVEKISVKHTIREFDEDETAAILKGLILKGVELEEIPKRLAAAIRQTMSQACLSTAEPLRIMYTGSPGALRDIVHKLSTAIFTSGLTGQKGKASQRNSDVYNIVPITSHDSGHMPEIELMESSGYQIAVDHCTRAEEIVIDGGSFPDETVYSITIGEVGQVGQTSRDKTYKSLFSPSGSIIQPKWTLPHVAIFFCTENEDEVAQRTREMAWEFMSRHGVPSIFICNEQSFTKPPSGRWRDFVDQHAVHLCLESRDPERPILPQRLPIDIATFLNIDARQMNRNLAYLTGLTEADDEPSVELKSVSDPETEETEEEEQRQGKSPLSPTSDLKQWATQFFEQHRQHMWSLAMTLLGGVFAMIVAAWLPSSGLLSGQRSTTTTPTLNSVSSILSTAAISTSTTTVIINVTSTKTVNLQRAEASASPLASALSFAGLLSDRVSTIVAEPEPTSTLCSIERYGDNEILIRIPTSKKSGWLARGAIDIDVFRGEVPIKAKLSSVDEGIVVGLKKKDAYGVLNISVVTTRKPKINETFEVNLGSSVLVEAFEAAAHIVQGIGKKAVDSGETVLNSGVGAIVKVAHTVEDGVRAIDDGILAAASKVAGAGQAAGHFAQDYSKQVVEGVMQSPKEVAKAIHDTREQITDRVAAAKADVELTVLKAQIASKLWSLKIRGKTEEYDKYQKKAAEFLKKRHDKLVQSLKASEEAFQKKCGCSGSKKEKARLCLQRCASSQGKKTSKAAGRWKKAVYGG